MSKESKKKEKSTAETPPNPSEEVQETAGQPAPEQPVSEQPVSEQQASDPKLQALQDQLAQMNDQYLRLLAEYDNYRKRTAREKEATWNDAKAATVKALLPVYDDLERALRQDTADEAYRKGVELTMAGLQKALTSLGVEEIPALGQSFDANLHNAVMHVEDEALGENIVKEVYQAGFKLGETVIRYAMVVVAN